MKVPFLDLKKVNKLYEDKFSQCFQEVFQSGWYIQGSQLEAFEGQFADYLQVKHCVGVGNGLDALKLILLAYGIGPGDEVLVPANTFIATWLAVTQCGATPVPVEPDRLTYNIDASKVEAAITPRTAAIIPVHLYGLPADMDPINNIAKKYGLFVIEDAAQSQGANYKGKPTGGLGHAAATSFYPGKNLGALGDGGAVLTNDTTIANKVRELRNYGSVIKYEHSIIGFNSRLDELQAAFLGIKLKDLDRCNDRRRDIAKLYSEKIKNNKVAVPNVPDWAEPVWHLYVVRSDVRDLLQKHLINLGIQTLVHYPTPPHKQACYSLFEQQSFPITEQQASEVLSLPISPIMSDAEVEYVIECINSFDH